VTHKLLRMWIWRPNWRLERWESWYCRWKKLPNMKSYPRCKEYHMYCFFVKFHFGLLLCCTLMILYRGTYVHLILQCLNNCMHCMIVSYLYWGAAIEFATIYIYKIELWSESMCLQVSSKHKASLWFAGLC